MCDDVSGGMYEYVATRMSDVATRGRVLIKRTRYSNAERLGSRVESRNQKSLVSPTRVIHRPGSCRPETPVLHGPPAAFQRPALCTTAACVGRRVRTPGQSPPHEDERNPPHASVSTDATYTYTNTYSQTSAALGAFGNSEHADAALKVAVATSAAAAEPAEAAPHEELEGHACR